MERVLRQPYSAEIEDFCGRAFDLDSGLVFYPVRHHSPACALHLQETIRLYKPEVILIEGPADAGYLLESIADKDSKPPFCIYYSYDDQEGKVSGEAEKYRAYYPFLAYSPEWVAICRAFEDGIPVSFIDLPYALRLINRTTNYDTQYSYNKDEEFEVNRYSALAAKKAGCRSFSEFWESRFELDGPFSETTTFVRGVLALGWFMREAESETDGSHLGERQREWYMSRRIIEAQAQYGRVLVVTGAFHVRGLLNQLNQETPFGLEPCREEQVAAYLMPYTFREADSKSGYNAGMPFPAYYQSVWEKLSQQKPDAFAATALEYIIKTARYARKTQPISLPDEINAYSMACSLASLRGKPCPGVYELLDGVRSAFVKGDINSTATFELDFLLRLLSGMGAGTVAANAYIPPVVLEFRALCGKFRLKTGTIQRQNVTLDLVKNPMHYQKSRFLHQLLFLETDFAQLESGPDYVNGKDKNLVREHWICRYSTQVETRLIDLSVYGASLSQVCASLIERKFCDSMTAEALGKLLLSVQVMGIEGFFSQYAAEITAVAENDRNFISLCKLIGSLQYLANMQRLMEGTVQPEVPMLIKTVFKTATELMPIVRTANEDEEQALCEQLLALYALTLEQPDWCDGTLLSLQADAALADGFCNSRFYGACLAIRSKQGAIAPAEFLMRISGYLESSLGLPAQSSSFICGVFLIARDVLFADESIFEQISQTIEGMEQVQFLEMLPNLRYAFTSFLPAELERLGKMVAKRYHTGDSQFAGSMAVTQEQLLLGVRLDNLAAAELDKWGLADG